MNVYLDQKELGPSDYQWLSAPHSDYQVGGLGMSDEYTNIKEKKIAFREKEETICIQTKKKPDQVIISGSIHLSIRIIRWHY